ncbi:unnamed protein product, partial [Symbiodinium sp. KB8]
MWATNMKKIPAFSRSLIEEVLAHDIHAVQTSGSFEESVHLVQKRHQSAQLQQYLCDFKAQVWTVANAMLQTGGQVECHFEAMNLVRSLVTSGEVLEYQ